jgi:hypothetical protein
MVGAGVLALFIGQPVQLSAVQTAPCFMLTASFGQRHKWTNQDTHVWNAWLD